MKNPITTVLDTAFSIPSVVLSVPDAILSADPNKIKNAVTNNYNRISGQCTENANFNAPECVKVRQQEELSRLNAMSLPQLDSYYEKEIAKNAKQHPKEDVDLVKSKLIEENIKLGTFQGYIRAAQVSGNPRYVTEHSNLVRTIEDKKDLEQFTVLRTDDLNNFFDVDFKPKAGKAGTGHKEHMGFFAIHSDMTTKEISGILKISKLKTAPSELSLGHYRLTINITMHLPSRFIRQSEWLGNVDKNIDHTETTTVVADVSPPSMSTSKSINFTVQTGATKLGSRGGRDELAPTGDPTFVVDIVKAEVI